MHAITGPIVVQGAVVWTEPAANWMPGKLIGHGVRFGLLDWATSLNLGLLLAITP